MPPVPPRCPIHRSELSHVGDFDGEHAYECGAATRNGRCSVRVWKPIRDFRERDTSATDEIKAVAILRD